MGHEIVNFALLGQEVGLAELGLLLVAVALILLLKLHNLKVIAHALLVTLHHLFNYGLVAVAGLLWNPWTRAQGKLKGLVVLRAVAVGEDQVASVEAVQNFVRLQLLLNLGERRGIERIIVRIVEKTRRCLFLSQ